MHSRIVAQRCVSRHSLNISGSPAGSHHHHASGSNGKHTCTTAHWRAKKQTTHRSDLTQHGQDLGLEGMNLVGKHLGSFRTAISCDRYPRSSKSGDSLSHLFQSFEKMLWSLWTSHSHLSGGKSKRQGMPPLCHL